MKFLLFKFLLVITLTSESQALRSAGTGNRHKIGLFAQHPRQRNLSRCSVLLFCRVLQQFQKFPIAFDIFRLILGHHATVILMTAEHRVLSVLTAQKTIGHRGKGHITNPQFFKYREQSFIPPCHHGITVLNRRYRANGMGAPDGFLRCFPTAPNG